MREQRLIFAYDIMRSLNDCRYIESNYFYSINKKKINHKELSGDK